MRIKNREPPTRPKYTPYLSGDSPQLLAGGQHDENKAGHCRVHTAVRQEVKPIVVYLTVGDPGMAVPLRGDRQHLSRGVYGNDSEVIAACDPIGGASRSASVVEQHFWRDGAAGAESPKREGVPQCPSKPAIKLGEAGRIGRVVG